MRIDQLLVAVAIAATVGAATEPSVAAPKAQLPVSRLDLGRVVRGTVVERDLVLSNTGTTALDLVRVRLTAPLRLVQMPARIPPGAEALLRVRVDTTDLEGPIDAELRVEWNDPALPEARVTVEGLVVAPVEVAPRPVVFLAARRGEQRHAVLEIINHEPEPLRIERVDHSPDRLGVTLEQVEPGRRFRLTLRLNPDGPRGKDSTAVVLTTSSQRVPRVRIPVHTLLRERVYTFPEAVDLGAVPITALDGTDGTRVMTQTLMVYGPADFQIRLRTDVPALRLRSERGPHGDRHQVTITVPREQVRVGPLTGTIYIETSDPQFPTIAVPVSGAILPR